MKNRIRKIAALLLAMLFLLSGCAKLKENAGAQENNADDGVEDTDVSRKLPDNPYINCDPHNTLFADDLSNSDFAILSMEEYLEIKERYGFASKRLWRSWEQFSALGEFYQAILSVDFGDSKSQYWYLYTDPNHSSKQYVYYVIVYPSSSIPGKDNCTFREYLQWWYGRNYPYDYEYTAEDFCSGDMTKADHVPDGNNAVFFPNDMMKIEFSGKTKDVKSIEIGYEGWNVKIYKGTLGRFVEKLDRTKFDSSKEPEILQKLLNTDTCMAAIKELMDPANGGYAS